MFRYIACSKSNPLHSDVLAVYISLVPRYQMNYIMSGVKTPCMSFLHGNLTSGSAAGVGMHTNLRFASPNVQFSLPECRVGFFPDGGACGCMSEVCASESDGRFVMVS